MNNLDQRIAAELQVNGGASWHQVARAVGSPESTVAHRARRMIDGGELRVVAIADPIRCGFGYTVLVQLECGLDASPQVTHALADRPDVRFLVLVTKSSDTIRYLIAPHAGISPACCLRSFQSGRNQGSHDGTTLQVLHAMGGTSKGGAL
jgi:DNA-binding Lrp family transcriptional regulator